MFGLLGRLIGGAVSPLVDQATAIGASLLRKLALFFVAALCMVVVIVALTIAFDLWIASLAGPIAGALAVAALYLAIAVVAVVLALRGGRKPAVVAEDPERQSAASQTSETVDRFAEPILAMLQNLGLRREQFAVLAGASLAKQLRPLPLVGVAVVAGFLVGRLWRGWDALISSDLVESLLDIVIPGRGSDTDEPADDDSGKPAEADRKAA